jgi:UDP-GlcNAc:undecaprenyl-phosphate GlcNAc-1-phosphate transferase
MIIGTAAFLLAVLATPAIRRAALGLGMVDRPAERKLHSKPVPLLGGVAIYGAVIFSLLLFPDSKGLVQLTGIVLGASWISFWGLWDDRFGLSPIVKLLAQVAAGVILIAVGVQVSLPVPDWVNIALTLFWVVGITNAFNLLDNMDGLSSGVAAVAAAWIMLMAAMNGQFLVGGLAAAVLGACLGFLIHNFNPARIFMGDSGSLFLGFMMAVLGIKLRFPANVNWVTWMVPVLVLGVPVFDTALVFISRLRRRKNPFTTPGKDHLSHRLTRIGWTGREVVLLLYLAGCALGGTATFVSLAAPLGAYLIIAAVIVLALGAIVRLEQLDIAEDPPNATFDIGGKA